MKIIISILANSLAILAADKLLAGFNFYGSWIELLIAGTVLGVINGLVKPIIKLISLPFIFLTLGLFHIVINVAMLFLAQKFIHGLEINGLMTAVWAVFIISLVNYAVSSAAKKLED